MDQRKKKGAAKTERKEGDEKARKTMKRELHNKEHSQAKVEAATVQRKKRWDKARKQRLQRGVEQREEATRKKEEERKTRKTRRRENDARKVKETNDSPVEEAGEEKGATKGRGTHFTY